MARDDAAVPYAPLTFSLDYETDALSGSHAHWDHMGDPSTFDGKTDLIVGPGFKNHYLSGDGGNSALGGVLPSDVK